MATAVIDIWNGALSAIRAKGRLSDISENSREREEAEIWYPLVRDTVQEAAYWPGCKATARLALKSERNFGLDWVSTDPAPQFRYRYAIPTNYLRAWHLASFATFSIEMSDDGIHLHTNEVDAVLVYARRQETVQFWTASQRLATIMGLASFLASPLTGKNGEQFARRANDILLDAQVAAANAEEQELNTFSPVLAARGYTDQAPRTRYFYPFGNVFTASAANA